MSPHEDAHTSSASLTTLAAKGDAMTFTRAAAVRLRNLDPGWSVEVQEALVLGYADGFLSLERSFQLCTSNSSDCERKINHDLRASLAMNRRSCDDALSAISFFRFEGGELSTVNQDTTKPDSCS